ncbi:MAG: DUF2141 domain-containing protein [Vicingaceae bacterium]
MLRFILLISLFTFLSLSSNENASKGTLIVKVEGIKKVEGNVGVLVFNKSQGFPDDKTQAILSKEVKVLRKSLSISLPKLPYGDYAIALVHDVNANKKLDRTLIGIPKEPFGFSNNKSIFKGLPNFKEAAVRLDGSKSETVIRLVDLW